MKLTIIRHGETTLNKEGIFSGIIVCNLTEEAIEKANDLRFSNNLFDYVYTSPLKRTKITAQAVYPYIESISCGLIIERNLGCFEGVLKSSIDNQILEKFRKNEFLPEGAEKDKEVEQRVIDFFNMLKEKHNENDRILIVTHNGIIRKINKLFFNSQKYSVDNLEVLEIEM